MPIEEKYREFRDALCDAEVLVATSVEGVYARSGTFERIIEGIDGIVVRAGADQNATVLRFPAIFPRATYEHTDYLASFPQLTGSIHSYNGDERGVSKLVEAQEAGEDWGHDLEQTDLMLVSAACHPTYPLFAGQLPEGGRYLDVYGSCFRREPSPDPARMQAFRMHEYVHLGDPDSAQKHRDTWVDRGLAVLEALQLPARQVVANDPFFGRSGRMLAANQRAENLKMELVLDLYDGEGDGTAVVSCNCHRDHFGANFGITSADGEVAHSACVGFGMERIALGLLKHHGLDPERWPSSLRGVLWP